MFREAACQAIECSVQQVISYTVKGPVWIQRADMLIFLKMSISVMGLVFFHQANVDFNDGIFLCAMPRSHDPLCSLVESQVEY